MNKSYKSIWNESLGTYVAAAETAASSGRKVSSARKSRRAPERAHSSQIALEQRIVFDAAMPATVLETQVDQAAAQDVVLEEIEQLEAEFETHWLHQIADREAFFNEVGPRIVAVSTGAHTAVKTDAAMIARAKPRRRCEGWVTIRS